MAVERRHARVIGVAAAQVVRDVRRRDGRRACRDTATDAVRPVAVGAGGDARLARRHLLAVGARQVLRVLVDAHLRGELPHVVRVGVALRAERRDRPCASIGPYGRRRLDAWHDAQSAPPSRARRP